MRLLDTETGQFVDGVDPESIGFRDGCIKTTWVYAILSHTWDKEGEQTYEQLMKIQEKYPPPQVKAPESSPDGPNADTSSSPEQPEGGPPPAHLPSSQLPSDLVLVNSGTSLTASSPPTKSWFTRRMAGLKRLFQRRSARSAPQRRAQSHSLSTATHPLPTVGCLTQSEVETLFRAFGEAYDLKSATPAPTPSHPSAPSHERQSEWQPPKSIWDDPELSPKIKNACVVAQKRGYRYIWIDSCCIDKSSSSELSEAINSMFKWYSLADVCYAYLADVPPGEDHHAENSRFRESRWFTRGWTLQELIAPINVEFLSKDWIPIGSKHTHHELIERITRINYRALLHLDPLSSFGVAQRLSWAARRETTRVEDRAYSLLGIFGIHMSTLYGEGSHAFQRLQEQIMQRLPDQSLFAWGDIYLPDSPQLLKNQVPNNSIICVRAYGACQSASAESPSDFEHNRNIHQIELPAFLHHKIGYTSTPYGICTQFQMIPLTSDFLSHILLSGEVKLELPNDSNQWYLAILGCEHMAHPGRLLGRVCYIPPSKSGVDFVYAGYIQSLPRNSDLLSLSLDTIKRFHSNIKLKTVYIPYPYPANQFESLRRKPYSMIKLVLLTETRDTLRSRGYRVDLRNPDPDHPTTHWLTLSNDERTITVEFQHALNWGGKMLTINVEVKVSRPRLQLEPDSAPDSYWMDLHIVSWKDFCWSGWKRSLGPEPVRLSAAGGETPTVDLSLDFAGMGFYFVRVDVRSDAPPAPADVDLALPASPAVESAGGMAKEVEVTEDDLSSDGVDTEDSDAGRDVEAGGHGMASLSVNGGRVEEVSGDTADGEERGGSA